MDGARRPLWKRLRNIEGPQKEGGTFTEKKIFFLTSKKKKPKRGINTLRHVEPKMGSLWEDKRDNGGKSLGLSVATQQAESPDLEGGGKAF